MAASNSKLHQTAPQAARRALATGVVTVTGSGLGLTGAVLAAQALAALRRPLATLDDAVAALAALGTSVLLLAWCTGAVATAAGVLLRAAGREHRPVEAAAALAPAVLRRLVQRSVAVVLGVAVVGGAAAGPALAATTAATTAAASARQSAASAEAGGDATAGLTWPARAAAPPSSPALPSPSEGARREVVVRAGDTLWGIARAGLPAGASTAQVAGTWPLWYAANRDVIGDDPDLLLPGQRLTAPGSTS